MQQGTALEFSHPCLVFALFTGPFLLEMKLYKNFFPWFLYFLSVSKQLSNATRFTLISHCRRTCLSLATKQSLLLSSECDHTADECVYHQRQEQALLLTSKYDITLQMNMFITSNKLILAGKKHYSHWRRMCFMLEMNTLMLETNELKMQIQTSATHIHVQYTQSWLLVTFKQN